MRTITQASLLMLICFALNGCSLFGHSGDAEVKPNGNGTVSIGAAQ